MNYARALPIGLIATFAAILGSAAASAAVIEVVVDGNTGATTVRCQDLECETVDCSGNGQLIASGNAYAVRRDNESNCTTDTATPEQAENLDQKQQESDDLFAAAEESDNVIPAAAPTPDADQEDNSVAEVNETNQNQVGDTGQGSPETTTQLQDLNGG